MPNFPITDAHVHLWDSQRFPITWLAGHATLDRPYGINEYRAHTAGVQVAAFVYVEVDVEPPFGLLEAQWALERAQEDPRLQGIIAAAPLEYGDHVRVYLEALAALGPHIKGVRRILQGERDPAFCLQPDFVRGVQLLPEFGFSFDICIYHPQLASAVELVRRCPETQFMLDHIAKPGIKDGLLDPWRAQIEELAALPNVICKISGMATEADHQNWTTDNLAPYVAHVLAAFGEDRVAFGSDWPVLLLAGEYQRWVATLDTLTTHLSPEAQRKLWSENARRFYRLGE
jgi:L-fuconolactonase